MCIMMHVKGSSTDTFQVINVLDVVKIQWLYRSIQRSQCLDKINLKIFLMAIKAILFTQ